MTLREEFIQSKKNNTNNLDILFETSNQKYIEWLEEKINSINTTEQSNDAFDRGFTRGYNIAMNIIDNED